MSFFENTRKPEGFGGKIMVAMMNIGHSAVARWGLRFLKLTPDDKVLDCGCGGGANIKRMLKKCPQGIVKGIDYSTVSVENQRKSTNLPLQKDAAPYCVQAYQSCRLNRGSSMWSRPLKQSISGPTYHSALGRFGEC